MNDLSIFYYKNPQWYYAEILRSMYTWRMRLANFFFVPDVSIICAEDYTISICDTCGYINNSVGDRKSLNAQVTHATLLWIVT